MRTLWHIVRLIVIILCPVTLPGFLVGLWQKRRQLGVVWRTLPPLRRRAYSLTAGVCLIGGSVVLWSWWAPRGPAHLTLVRKPVPQWQEGWTDTVGGLTHGTHTPGTSASRLRRTYYVVPNGTGTGCSPNDPCLACDVWQHVQPGDTVVYRTGHYRGSANMLRPPEGLHGRPEAPITIQAEPGVLLDGEYQTTPMALHMTSHVTVQDFAACCGLMGKIVSRFETEATILRRMVWFPREVREVP